MSKVVCQICQFWEKGTCRRHNEETEPDDFCHEGMAGTVGVIATGKTFIQKESQSSDPN